MLVVGAGPVGLMSGILLSEQGLGSLVLERRDAVQRAPAAHVVNARTLEICRSAGVDMEAVAAVATDPADGGRVHFVTHLTGERLGGHPFERQGDDCLAFTPTPLRNISQHHFEPILLERLRKCAHAEVRYGHRWEGAQQDAAGVTSRVRDLATDEVSAAASCWPRTAPAAGCASPWASRCRDPGSSRAS